jgi:hypothetical protein
VIISFFGLLTAIYFAAAVNFSMAILIFVALRLTGQVPVTLDNRGADALDSERFAGVVR